MFSPLHPSLPLPSFCASDHSPHLFVLTLFLFFFSLNPPSVFLLDRGGPASETQAWYLPLPQLPHPLHRHSVSSWFWLSGLWSWLRPQSHHPTPSPLHSLRLCLAEKERVLHRGPAAGSLRYSRTAVCHQVTRPHECVWASLVHWAMRFKPRSSRIALNQLNTHAVTAQNSLRNNTTYWLFSFLLEMLRPQHVVWCVCGT